MAMGKPVITTDNEQCSSAIDQGINGLIVPVKDSIALANAIKTIINDKALAKKFGQNSRVKAVKELNEKLIMEKLLKAIM